MLRDMYLETDRLILKPFAPDDLCELQKIVSQKEVMKHLPEDVMTLDETRRILTWLIDCYGKNTAQKIIKYTVGVFNKEDGKLFGWCGLGPLEFDESEIEIYYGLSQDYWGMGLATEAAGAMLNFGFYVIGLDKIVVVVARENIASVRVIEKLGMIYRKKLKNLSAEHKTYEGDSYYSLSKEGYNRTKVI